LSSRTDIPVSCSKTAYISIASKNIKEHQRTFCLPKYTKLILNLFMPLVENQTAASLLIRNTNSGEEIAGRYYFTSTSFENNKNWSTISNRKKTINTFGKFRFLYFCLE